jgi:hypothetical protein
MTRRTALYLLAPVFLLVVWSTLYLVWGDRLGSLQRARVEIQPATVVESNPASPKLEPLDPAIQELIQPMNDSRREWMDAMAAERKQMITQAYAMLDELEQALPPEE